MKTRIWVLMVAVLLAAACGNRELDDLQVSGGGAAGASADQFAVGGDESGSSSADGLGPVSGNSEAAGTSPGDAAASSAGGDASTPEAPAAGGDASTPEAPAAGGDASNVGAGQTLLIGTVDTRTAPVTICRGAWEGVSAFFADLNARGGVNGYQVKLVGMDDGMDANRNQSAVRQLVGSDNVLALVSHCSEFSNSQAAGYTTEQGVPVIGGAGIPSVWFQTANWFPTGGSQQQLYPKFMIDWSKKTLQCQRVGLLYVNIPEGQGGARYTRQYAAQAGMEVVFDSAFSLTEPDFTAFVVRMKEAGVECISMPGTGDMVTRMLKAMAQQNLDAKLVAPLPAFDPLIGPAVGEFTEGHLFSVINHAPPALSESEHFYEAMATSYPDFTPNTWSIDGWSAGEVFVEAVRRVGEQPVTRESLMTALHSFENWQGTFTPPLTYSEGPKTFPAGCNSVVAGNPDGTWSPASDRFLCTDGY